VPKDILNVYMGLAIGKDKNCSHSCLSFQKYHKRSTLKPQLMKQMLR